MKETEDLREATIDYGEKILQLSEQLMSTVENFKEELSNLEMTKNNVDRLGKAVTEAFDKYNVLKDKYKSIVENCSNAEIECKRQKDKEGQKAIVTGVGGGIGTLVVAGAASFAVGKFTAGVGNAALVLDSTQWLLEVLLLASQFITGIQVQNLFIKLERNSVLY